MYDHESERPLSNEVEDHIGTGFVHYTPFTGHHTKFESGYSNYLSRFMRTAQGYAYSDCIKWVAA